MTENNPLRETFDIAAQDYDAIRPGYPAQLFEDVIRLSGIPEQGQALEIGCGTGQATLPFARCGYTILCLDIGANMLALARENLREFPGVQFQHVSFEDWPLIENRFDLVFSATAFHWIPPEIGYGKAAQALKPGGALAVFSNQHPRQSDFFWEVQPIYRQLVPEWGDPTERPSIEAEIGAAVEYIRSTGHYASVEAFTYPWIKTYTTREYLQLLNTYSGHLSLEEGRRRSLFQSIADLIERRFGGKLDHPYLTVLYLAKR